jgi:FKBP-type peptidyl-prolyl cis-trans isomerase FklB
MKLAWVAIVISLFFMACQSSTQEKAHVKTFKDSVSYSIGMNIGRDFKHQLIDIDADLLAQGIKDIVAGSTTILTDSQAQSVMMSFQKDLMGKQEAKNKELGDKNKKEGEDFLAANKTKEGVKVTASGLQYKVIKEGTGPKPKPEQTVQVHYRGTLIDGTEFDSSIKRGQPAEFQLTGVIKGWTEALQLMSVGSKWQLYIPAELAWGPQGTGRLIGPNAVVLFEVELLAIK